jgi:hypothetical protein
MRHSLAVRISRSIAWTSGFTAHEFREVHAEAGREPGER